MAARFRKAMDALYLVCVLIAGTALVLISAVIPWAVFTRYVLNSSASWPERTAVLLTIVLTFIGTAACYRARLHMNVSFFAAMLPPVWRRRTDLLVELLVGAMSLFMVVYGAKLVEATWANSIDEFPELSVGLTYLPIPLGGAALLLFVIERIFIGAPAEEFVEHSAVEQAAPGHETLL
jgi:TRAP-type C4-dicarboxylate transport system permease small subunit